MATDKITTSIRLDATVLRQLQEIASNEVRSVNNLVEYILTKYIREYSEKEGD